MKTEPYLAKISKLEPLGKKKINSGCYYSFLLLLAGGCTCEQEGIRLRFGFEDMLLMKPGYSQILEGNKSGGAEYILIQYTPELLEGLSDNQTDLIKSLNVVPSKTAVVHADSEILMLMKNIARRLSRVKGEKEFAKELFEKSLLTMLVVLILRACISAEFAQKPKRTGAGLIESLFTYIRTHLTENLTLDQLAEAFYVSKYHISRQFKKQTGITIHQYITDMRLELCKKYIREGLPVIDIYKKCGFGGYNHFFRAFKKKYGMTPKQYRNSTLENPIEGKKRQPEA